ncbi:MAG: diphosphomevalonate decarboxylase, partial [Bdellovibrionales bacterium]|nr:diphosphomevalonate decarboxylase [Bdellovibrionales bacterium]
SESGIRRFIAHFEFLKKSWRIPGHYILSSLNNFPADCGLASSASSFAALTRATAKLARLKGQVAESELSLPCLSEMSRRGSGSSCRSFYSPWSLWQRGGAEPLHNTELVLLHQVVVVESGKKSVSSSEAHRRVPSSALFKGRPERAEARLKSLIQVIAESDWRHGFEICWSEFWDMHALFETSFPSFGYMKPASLAVLELIRKEWEVNQDGPWVTMDAGANVHLLYREDQKNLAQNLKTSLQKFGKVLGL